MTQAKRRVQIDGKYYNYDDATQSVVIQRELIDVWLGNPGKAGECMNAKCILRNRDAFPHRVLAASVIKTKVYIVDDVDHVVRYTLSKRDSNLISSHDVERIGEPGTLVLRAPRPYEAGGLLKSKSPSNWPSGSAGRTGRTNRPLAKGERARMMAAVGALN